MRSLCICPWRREIFRPHPRLGERQKCCGKPDCLHKQKLDSHVRWKAKNTDVYRAGQKDWRIQNSGYSKTYRATHPEYVERNRQQTRRRKARLRAQAGLQKRIDIPQVIDNYVFLWGAFGLAKENQSYLASLHGTRMADTPFQARAP